MAPPSIVNQTLTLGCIFFCIRSLAEADWLVSDARPRSVSTRMVNRKAAHEVLVERRVLLAVTGFLALGCLLWIIAMSTNYWGIVDGGTGVYIASSKHYFLRSYTGIWKTCRTAYENSSKDVLTGEYCSVFVCNLYDLSVCLFVCVHLGTLRSNQLPW